MLTEKRGASSENLVIRSHDNRELDNGRYYICVLRASCHELSPLVVVSST
jgi:hypothetical protein